MSDIAVTDYITNGSDQTFMSDVIEASQTQPVIVDFWAPWCGPCRQLMPALERVVKDEAGAVKLVKINIDENPGVAGQLGVQSIPAVFAFKNGQPVDGFKGGQPESELKKFVGRLTGEHDAKDEALKLVARAKDSLAAGDPGGAAQDFAGALQLDPLCAAALAGLARLYVDSDNPDGAAELLKSADPSIENDPEITAVRAMIDLSQNASEPDELVGLKQAVQDRPDDLDARFTLAQALAASGHKAEAVDHLLLSIAKNRAHNDEAARLFLLTLFEAEGPQSDISIDGRRRLSSILFA